MIRWIFVQRYTNYYSCVCAYVYVKKTNEILRFTIYHRVRYPQIKIEPKISEIYEHYALRRFKPRKVISPQLLIINDQMHICTKIYYLPFLCVPLFMFQNERKFKICYFIFWDDPSEILLQNPFAWLTRQQKGHLPVSHDSYYFVRSKTIVVHYQIQICRVTQKNIPIIHWSYAIV